MSFRRAFICFSLLCLVSSARAREQQDFNFGWKFFKGDPKNAQAAEFNDSSWKDVDLPHDWSIEHKFHPKAAGDWRGGYAVLGKGWYRKKFIIPADKKGQEVCIEFDGIYKNSTVWINGTELGTRWYGYVPFRYDLTPYVRWGGSNVMAVKVDTPKQTCRWYSGSGIYRNVYLAFTGKLAVDRRGTYVRTPEVSAGSATVEVQTDVVNHHKENKSCTIITSLHDE